MQRFFRRNDGFTFIEALLQLVILIIFTQLLLSHQVVLKTLHQTFYSEDVLWEMFVYDFQRYIDAHERPFRIVRNHTLEREIYDDVLDADITEKFDVATTSHYIRRSFNKGNEPLLYGVRNMHASIVGNILKLQVTFLNGDVKERSFYVPIEK